MIPLLPDFPGAPGPLSPGGALPQGPVPTGTGLDFAGLLGAALPQSVAAGEPALLAASTPSDVPSGKIVPDPGAPLPPMSLSALPVGALSSRPGSDEALDGPEAAEIEPDFAALMPAGIAMPLPDLVPPDPSAPDPALIAALIPASATAPAAAPLDDAQSARGERAVVARAVEPEKAPTPARVTSTLPPPEDAAPPLPASAAAAPLTPAAILPAPETPAPPSPLLAQALPPPPATLPTPAPERIDALRAPSPQLESTIAQVGDLREALRSARPEMTLRHGEFGFVALRLEQTGAQDWRAVLASRDPGFVPAIHAALAERAVAAASASADGGSFLGHQSAGQNGTSDQRYGASPNGGQGGSQPYLGHSANRDGEAAPDHRRPSTAAALAARAEEGEEASGSPAGPIRGMFA